MLDPYMGPINRPIRFFTENMTLHWLAHWNFISIYGVCSL